MTSQTGTTLDARYELLARLDDFGRGENWYARDTRLKNRFVVVKLLDPGASSRGALSDHIAAYRGLRHPNVLPVVNQGVVGDRPYLVLQHFDGRSLGSGLDEARATGNLLPVDLLQGLFARIATAVAAGHHADPPLIHGCLDPGCVLLRGDGAFEVRVLDFGLGPYASVDAMAPERSARRRESLAPEHYGAETLTPAADVFCLGALLRDMLVRPPDMGATFMPSAFEKLRDDVPDSLWEVTGYAMSRSPTDRFGSVEALLMAVQSAWQHPVVPRARASVKPAVDPAPEAPVTPLGLTPPMLHASAILAPPAPSPLLAPPDAPSITARLDRFAESLPLPAISPAANPWSTESLARSHTVDLSRFLEAAAPSAGLDKTVVSGDEVDLSATAIDAPRLDRTFTPGDRAPAPRGAPPSRPSPALDRTFIAGDDAPAARSGGAPRSRPPIDATLIAGAHEDLGATMGYDAGPSLRPQMASLDATFVAGAARPPVAAPVAPPVHQLPPLASHPPRPVVMPAVQSPVLTPPPATRGPSETTRNLTYVAAVAIIVGAVVAAVVLAVARW